MVFLVPLIYHGAAAAWGKSGRYPAVLSAYAHAQVPTLIRGALTVAIAYPRDKLDPEGMARLLKSNVGAFLDPESTPKALLALLTNLDIFDLWAVALAAIALPRVTRLSQGAATAVVVGLWLVYVLIVTGLAALGAAFGG
jgi:hypothetical protein